MNIRAKKTTPSDVLKDINLEQVPKLHQTRFNNIIRKFAPTVLSYDKTDSNILRNHIFDLQMIPNHDTFHNKPKNISPGLETHLDDLIDEYLEKGYLIPIEHPKITSSVFLVLKNSNEKLNVELNKDAGKETLKYRMVVDYMEYFPIYTNFKAKMENTTFSATLFFQSKLISIIFPSLLHFSLAFSAALSFQSKLISIIFPSLLHTNWLIWPQSTKYGSVTKFFHLIINIFQDTKINSNSNIYFHKNILARTPITLNYLQETNETRRNKKIMMNK